VKRPQVEARVRLPGDQTIASMSPLELLDLYWQSSHARPEDAEALKALASQVIADVHGGADDDPL
jgi:exonuclease SbcD